MAAARREGVVSAVVEDPKIARVVLAWQIWRATHDLESARHSCCRRSRLLFDALEELSREVRIPAGLAVGMLQELEGGWSRPVSLDELLDGLRGEEP